MHALTLNILPTSLNSGANSVTKALEPLCHCRAPEKLSGFRLVFEFHHLRPLQGTV